MKKIIFAALWFISTQSYVLSMDDPNNAIHDYNLFKILHKTRDSLEESIVRNANKTGLSKLISVTIEDPNPLWNQTRTGMFLRVANGSPSYFYTPWGDVKLDIEFGLNLDVLPTIIQDFCQQLNVELQKDATDEQLKVLQGYLEDSKVGLTSKALKERYCNAASASLKDFFQHLKLELCSDATDSDGYNKKIYKILSVDGITLPVPEEIKEFKDYREIDTVKKAWNVLMERYIKEKPTQ